jgi:hypothetical protein
MIRLELGTSADPLRVGVELGPGTVARGEVFERNEVRKIRACNSPQNRADPGARKRGAEMAR